MINENTRKKLKDCTIAALVFYILAFIFSFVAGALAYIDPYFYDYYGNNRFDYAAYIGAIMETVATILLFILIILCIVLMLTKKFKNKGLAGAIVGISCLVFVSAMVGMIFLLCSSCKVGWIISVIGLVITFIALIMSLVCLIVVTKKHKSEDEINNRQIPRTDALIVALREYKELHDSGLLTDEEYSVQKAKILEQLEM